MSISGNRPPLWTEARDAFIFGIAALTKVERPAGARGAGAGPATGDDAPAGPDAAARADDANRTAQPRDVALQGSAPAVAAASCRKRATGSSTTCRCIASTAASSSVSPTRKCRTWSSAAAAAGRSASSDDAYELMANMTGQSFRDIYAVDTVTGQKKVVKKQSAMGQQRVTRRRPNTSTTRTGISTSSTSNRARRATSRPPCRPSFVNRRGRPQRRRPADDRRRLGGRQQVRADFGSLGHLEEFRPSRVETAVNLTVNGKTRRDPLSGPHPHRSRGARHRPDQAAVFLGDVGMDQARRLRRSSSRARPGLTMLLWEDASIGRPGEGREGATSGSTAARRRPRRPRSTSTDATLQGRPQGRRHGAGSRAVRVDVGSAARRVQEREGRVADCRRRCICRPTTRRASSTR